MILVNERKFEFAFDLVLGANDPGLYADLLNGAEVNSGVLITPEWVGWEGDRNSFFLKILSYAPENELVASLRSHTELLELRFFENEKFPMEVLQFKNLQYLHLRGGTFGTLPPEIGALHNIRDLNLECVGLHSLPGEFENLKRLRRLDLNGNDFSSLSSNLQVLCKLDSLEILMLSYNNIAEFETYDWLKLKKLSSVTINGNMLCHETLTKVFDVASTRTIGLIELFLDGCGIHEIPSISSGFDSLIKLDLANNAITELPGWIEKLPNLKWLNLEGNPINT